MHAETERKEDKKSMKVELQLNGTSEFIKIMQSPNMQLNE